MSKRITKKGVDVVLWAAIVSLIVAVVTLYLINPTLLALLDGSLGWILLGAVWLLLVFFFLLHDERPKKGSAAWHEAAQRNIAREKAFITELMSEDASKATPGKPGFSASVSYL